MTQPKHPMRGVLQPRIRSWAGQSESQSLIGAPARREHRVDSNSIEVPCRCKSALSRGMKPWSIAILHPRAELPRGEGRRVSSLADRYMLLLSHAGAAQVYRSEASGSAGRIFAWGPGGGRFVELATPRENYVSTGERYRWNLTLRVGTGAVFGWECSFGRRGIGARCGAAANCTCQTHIRCGTACGVGVAHVDCAKGFIGKLDGGLGGLGLRWGEVLSCWLDPRVHSPTLIEGVPRCVCERPGDSQARHHPVDFVCLIDARIWAIT